MIRHEIVKYRNRKMYSYGLSKYVDFSDLYKCILAGEELFIETKVGGRDITDEVLTEVILQRESEQEPFSAWTREQLARFSSVQECINALTQRVSVLELENGELKNAGKALSERFLPGLRIEG